MNNPTVKTILSTFLVDHGYEGLYNVDGGCSCTLSEFMPCGMKDGECEAGHIIQCDKKRGCEINCDDCTGLYVGKK